MPRIEETRSETDFRYTLHAPVDVVAVERAARAAQGAALAALFRRLGRALTRRPAPRVTGGHKPA